MSEWTQKKWTRGGEGGTRIEGGRVREVEEGGKKEGRKEGREEGRKEGEPEG